MVIVLYGCISLPNWDLRDYGKKKVRDDGVELVTLPVKLGNPTLGSLLHHADVVPRSHIRIGIYMHACGLKTYLRVTRL